MIVFVFFPSVAFLHRWVHPTKAVCQSALAGIAVAILAGSAGAAGDMAVSLPMPPARDGSWIRVLWVDFGPAARRASGALAMDPTYRYDDAAWTNGMVRVIGRDARYGAYFGDLAEGEDASFVLGIVPDDSYRVVLQLGDPEARRGPVDVTINGVLAGRAIETKRGEFVDVSAEVPARDGRIVVLFRPARCASFSAAGLAVYHRDNSTAVANPLRSLFPRLTPAGGRPSASTGSAAPQVLAREQLRSYCDFLVARRPREGCFSFSGNWYESSFPLRALVAGARLLGEPRYLESAFDCMDRFVSEGRPESRWASQYFGHRGCELAAATVSASESSNLADLGTMALCLSMAADAAKEPRRSLYLEYALNYADHVVLPNQLANGAFPNLRYEGRDYRFPYGVATGVQATNLSALYEMTGDARYRDAAERAALFLAAACRADGKVASYDYRSPVPVAIDPVNLGDFFYVVEGMLWTQRVARPEAAERIREGLDRYFLGMRGLVRWEGDDSWWAPKKPWEESKRAGLLYLLNLYRATGRRSDGAASFADAVFTAMGDDQYAMQFGIREDPASPRGRFGLAATGMAGLGAATMLDASTVFPSSIIMNATR